MSRLVVEVSLTSRLGFRTGLVDDTVSQSSRDRSPGGDGPVVGGREEFLKRVGGERRERRTNSEVDVVQLDDGELGGVEVGRDVFTSSLDVVGVSEVMT